MRNELATAIIASIFGVIVSFFVCNLFIGEVGPASVKVVDSNISTSLVDPNPEVFNYKALNPTVEVYVGSCSEYNASGECVDQVTEEEFNSIVEEGIIQGYSDSQNSNSQNSTNQNSTNANSQEKSTKQENP